MERAQEVLAQYDIGEVEALAPAGGTAGKCWRATTRAAAYFLRRRGPRTSSEAALAFDHGLRRHLLAQGVPTAAPLATTSGETWVRTEEGVFELYPFVPGRAYGDTPQELEATARALARFHGAARSYPRRGSYTPVPKQFALAAPEVGGTARIDDPGLVRNAFRRIAQGEPAMAYALRAAEALAEEDGPETYAALPQELTHGDYHPGNLRYDEAGEVAGIFDLDWACEHTRARDLADALIFFAGDRAAPLDGGRIESLTAGVATDLDKARRFLHAYTAAAPLTRAEAQAIPLAMRARWLAMRLEGSAKVAPECRVWFITRELELPLDWIAAHGGEVVAAGR